MRASRLQKVAILSYRALVFPAFRFKGKTYFIWPWSWVLHLIVSFTSPKPSFVIEYKQRNPFAIVAFAFRSASLGLPRLGLGLLCWPLCCLCFTSLVSVTGFYTEDEPQVWSSSQQIEIRGVSTGVKFLKKARTDLACAQCRFYRSRCTFKSQYSLLWSVRSLKCPHR